MTRHAFGSYVVALLTLLACVPVASAQATRVQVRAGASSETAYVGQSVRFLIEVQGTTDADQPTIDAVPGLDLRFAGGSDRSSSSVMIINGRRTERSTKAYVFTWVATASSAGRFTIPPVEVTAEGVKYTTRPVDVRFVDPPQSEHVLFDVSVEREAAYVGEPVRITFDTYYRFQRERLRFSFPGLGEEYDLYPPASVLFEQGTQSALSMNGTPFYSYRTQIEDDGVIFLRERVELMLVPKKSGTLRLGAPTVVVTPESRGLLRGRPDDQYATAAPLEFEVRELPSEGRPANFNGLIGAYSIQTIANTSSASVGDPIEVTLAVGGPLVESVRAPALHLQHDLTEGFRVPEDLGLSQVENGRIVWRFTIRPTSDGVSKIPPIELPYFDTDTGAYEVARSEAIPLEVSASRRVTLTDAEGLPLLDGPGQTLEETTTGIAYNYEGEGVLVDQRFTIGSALASPVAVAATAGSFGLWAASLVFVTAKRRAGGEKTKSERKRAGAIAKRELSGAADAGGVSGAVYGYVGRKLGRAASGLTPAECEGAVGGELGIRVRELLEACDASAYAGSGSADVSTLASRAADAIDSMEKEWKA